MKFQLILLLLACVIKASKIDDDEKSDHKEIFSSFLCGATNPTGIENKPDRKITKALEQEKRRQSELERIRKEILEEEKEKEKREENEAEARERLQNIVEYNEEKKTLSVNYFAESPKKNKFCFLYNMCRKKEKTSKDFANVEFAKFAVTEDNANELVVVILSREKENFPGKFDEFIVDLGRNVIKHNDIQNAFGEETFKEEAEQNKKEFVKGKQAFTTLNPYYRRESQTKMFMMDQEKNAKEMFSESAHAEELQLKFKIQGIGGVIGAHYGAFRSRDEYSLSQK